VRASRAAARLIASAAVLASLCVPSGATAAVSYLSGPEVLNDPGSIETNSAGQLVVLDSTHTISTFALDGRLTGSFSATDGDYWGATGDLAVGQDDSIYVAHSATSVSHWTGAGQPLTAVGSPTYGDPAHLQTARAVAVDSAGDIYVLDAADQTDRVVKFAADGTYVTAWPVVAADGSPRRASALAARGEVIAVATPALDVSTPGEMLRYGTDGTLLSRWPTLEHADVYGYRYSQVETLALGEGGGVFAANGTVIWAYGADGALRATHEAYPGQDQPSYRGGCEPVPESTDTEPQPAWPWPSFSALVRDRNGDVYATDTAGDRVIRIDRQPIVALEWGPQQAWRSVPATGDQVTYDAHRSRLPLGRLTRFEWDLDGNGTFETDTGATARATTAYATEGKRHVSVRVTGSLGAATTKSVDVPVVASSATVIAPRRVLTGTEFTIDASRSRPLCGGEARYEWDANGDGVFELDSGTKEYVTTTLDRPGTYGVAVRVTLPGGRVDVATRVVVVLPAPPPGDVGVTINHGALYTRDPVVEVSPVWPAFTSRIRIANDGGFREAKAYPIGESQRWLLDSSGPERLPKRVYVRFDGARHTGGPQNFTDDIILDERKPVLIEANVLAGRAATPTVATRRSVRLVVRARDNVSGVSRMQVATKRRHPGRWARFRRISRVRSTADALWVRVRDRAGNRSRWRRARSPRP
jgi:hypothetical protein